MVGLVGDDDQVQRLGVADEVDPLVGVDDVVGAVEVHVALLVGGQAGDGALANFSLLARNEVVIVEGVGVAGSVGE